VVVHRPQQPDIVLLKILKDDYIANYCDHYYYLPVVWVIRSLVPIAVFHTQQCPHVSYRRRMGEGREQL
jgi:hypothetical protein